MFHKIPALILTLAMLLGTCVCALAEWELPPKGHIRVTEIRVDVDLGDMSYATGTIYATDDKGKEYTFSGDPSKWFDDSYSYYGAAEYGDIALRTDSPGGLYWALADDSLCLMIFEKDGTNHGMCFVPGATFRYDDSGPILKLDQPDDQDDVVTEAVNKHLYSSPK